MQTMESVSCCPFEKRLPSAQPTPCKALDSRSSDSEEMATPSTSPRPSEERQRSSSSERQGQHPAALSGLRVDDEVTVRAPCAAAEEPSVVRALLFPRPTTEAVVVGPEKIRVYDVKPAGAAPPTSPARRRAPAAPLDETLVTARRNPHLSVLVDLLDNKAFTEENVLLELEAVRKRSLLTTAPFNHYLLPILAWYLLRDKFGETTATKYVAFLKGDETSVDLSAGNNPNKHFVSLVPAVNDIRHERRERKAALLQHPQHHYTIPNATACGDGDGAAGQQHEGAGRTPRQGCQPGFSVLSEDSLLPSAPSARRQAYDRMRQYDAGQLRSDRIELHRPDRTVLDVQILTDDDARAHNRFTVKENSHGQSTLLPDASEDKSTREGPPAAPLQSKPPTAPRMAYEGRRELASPPSPDISCILANENTDSMSFEKLSSPRTTELATATMPAAAAAMPSVLAPTRNADVSVTLDTSARTTEAAAATPDADEKDGDDDNAGCSTAAPSPSRPPVSLEDEDITEVYSSPSPARRYASVPTSEKKPDAPCSYGELEGSPLVSLAADGQHDTASKEKTTSDETLTVDNGSGSGTHSSESDGTATGTLDFDKSVRGRALSILLGETSLAPSAMSRENIPSDITTTNNNNNNSNAKGSETVSIVSASREEDSERERSPGKPRRSVCLRYTRDAAPPQQPKARGCGAHAGLAAGRDADVSGCGHVTIISSPDMSTRQLEPHNQIQSAGSSLTGVDESGKSLGALVRAEGPDDVSSEEEKAAREARRHARAANRASQLPSILCSLSLDSGTSGRVMTPGVDVNISGSSAAAQPQVVLPPIAAVERCGATTPSAADTTLDCGQRYARHADLSQLVEASHLSPGAGDLSGAPADSRPGNPPPTAFHLSGVDYAPSPEISQYADQQAESERSAFVEEWARRGLEWQRQEREAQLNEERMAARRAPPSPRRYGSPQARRRTLPPKAPANVIMRATAFLRSKK